MAEKTILTANQQSLLAAISKDPLLSKTFYLGGGTALAEYYLHHRLSEDLDFFTDSEFDPLGISIFFKGIQKQLNITKIEYQQSFHRNFFFVSFGSDTIKTEFTYYPFPRIEKGSLVNAIHIDSMLDIAVNKVFTIYQKPRSRDFIDLYLIIKETAWELPMLIKKTQEKFDTYIDLLQLGTQFLKVTEVVDFPRMLIELSPKIWQNFFLKEAKGFEKKILKD